MMICPLPNLSPLSLSPQGLQQIRCPPGLAFDLEKQTCDWKWAVTNCDKITKEKKAAPLLNTEEPLCDPNKLACGDAICINKELFCDGKPDCNDGSDENACGKYYISNCNTVCQNYAHSKGYILSIKHIFYS